MPSPRSAVTRAYVGLFSAAGDSPGHIREGLERLRAFWPLLANSDLYRERSLGAPCRYGMVAELDIDHAPRELEIRLRAIEAQHVADTVDGVAGGLELAVLALGGVSVDDARRRSELRALREHPAAILGLAEIAPQVSAPARGMTVGDLSLALPDDVRSQIDRIEGTAMLGPVRDLDYDAIGDAGVNYRALRPLSGLNVDIFERVATSIGLRSSLRVLEVGCGTGRFCTIFAKRGAHVTGLDRSASMLAVARQEQAAATGSIEYVRGDANTGLPPGPFDATVFFFSVQYMRLSPEFWRRLRASLAPNGVVAFATFPHLHFVETEHARFFPAIPRIDLARFPSVPRLCAHLRENDFGEIFCQDVVTVEETKADDLIARTQSRYLSTFHLLPEVDFERGLAAMRAAYAAAPTVKRTIRAVVISARAHNEAA